MSDAMASSSSTSDQPQLVEVAVPAAHDFTGLLMTKLPDLANPSCQLTKVRVDVSSLTQRLKAASARLEQVAGANSTPLNANWEEERTWDLSAERRVEFTILSV
eukprot:scaffold101406_cov35-Prasinocladus_malaysianus.AAC.1